MRLILVFMLFLVGCKTVPTSTEPVESSSTVVTSKKIIGITQKRAERTVIDGCNAFIAAAEKPASGKPWAWYAPTFIGQYPNAAIEPMFLQLLASGIAIAGIDVGESYGSVEGTAQYASFYREMVKRGYSRKPVLIAQSRGGLMLYNWAVENPQCVTCIVGIYPVLENRSYPGGGMAEKLQDRNPIRRLATLNVPAFHIHGDSDVLVPLAPNSGAMQKIYPKLTLKVVPGRGHQELPEFFQDPEMVKFILQHIKKVR